VSVKTHAKARIIWLRFWALLGAPEKGIRQLYGETGPCKEVGKSFARPKLHSSHPFKESATCSRIPTNRNENSTDDCAQKETCVSKKWKSGRSSSAYFAGISLLFLGLARLLCLLTSAFVPSCRSHIASHTPQQLSSPPTTNSRSSGQGELCR
jgi:hypothetical protein